MSSSVFVENIDSLWAFRASFVRFADQAEETLACASAQIQQSIERIQERELHWREEVSRLEAEVAAAADALSACEASGYVDDDGNYVEPECSAEASALWQAQQELEIARESLRQVQIWLARIDEALTTYDRTAHEFEKAVGADADWADARLRLTIAHYELARDAQLLLAPLRASTYMGPPTKALRPDDFDLCGPKSDRDKLWEAICLLGSTKIGARLVEAMRDLGTAVGFDDLNWDTIAQFDRIINYISISAPLREYSKSAADLAAHIAHEAWHRFADPSATHEQKIEQEIQARFTQVQVMRELPAYEYGTANRDNERIMALDEAAMKQEIEAMYPDSPDA